MTREAMEAEMERTAEREGMAISRFNVAKRQAVICGLAAQRGKRSAGAKAGYRKQFGTNRTTTYGVMRLQPV